MTNREKIIAEIERLKDFFKTEREKATTTDKGMVDKLLLSSKIVVLEELLVFINSLSDEKPSEDLEEFDGLEDSIIEFLSHVPENEPEHSETLYTYEQMQEIARHFAQWQKEQLMKSAIDAKIVNDEMSGCVVDCEQGCLVLEPHTYPIGQKLKIVIIKEDKE